MIYLLKNDINKKMEIHKENYELLEKEFIEYKNLIEKNKNNIINLNIQLQYLREEYKKEINKLKDYFEQKIEYLFKLISQYNVKGKEKNEIIINNENKININYKYEEINKIIDNKIKDFKDNIYSILGINQEKKNTKNQAILERFEKKLYDFFFDKNSDNSNTYLDELKKISGALLIKNIDSTQLVSNFLQKNVNNENTKFDENTKLIFFNKKLVVFKEIENISLSKIETNNIDEFIKQFREKYGIKIKDMDDKNLKNLITKNDFDEKEILKIILKKLKYLK